MSKTDHRPEGTYCFIDHVDSISAEDKINIDKFPYIKTKKGSEVFYYDNPGSAFTPDAGETVESYLMTPTYAYRLKNKWMLEDIVNLKYWDYLPDTNVLSTNVNTLTHRDYRIRNYDAASVDYAIQGMGVNPVYDLDHTTVENAGYLHTTVPTTQNVQQTMSFKKFSAGNFYSTYDDFKIYAQAHPEYPLYAIIRFRTVLKAPRQMAWSGTTFLNPELDIDINNTLIQYGIGQWTNEKLTVVSSVTQSLKDSKVFNTKRIATSSIQQLALREDWADNIPMIVPDNLEELLPTYQIMNSAASAEWFLIEPHITAVTSTLPDHSAVTDLKSEDIEIKMIQDGEKVLWKGTFQSSLLNKMPALWPKPTDWIEVPTTDSTHSPLAINVNIRNREFSYHKISPQAILVPIDNSGYSNTNSNTAEWTFEGKYGQRRSTTYWFISAERNWPIIDIYGDRLWYPSIINHAQLKINNALYGNHTWTTWYLPEVDTRLFDYLVHTIYSAPFGIEKDINDPSVWSYIAWPITPLTSE